MSVVLAAGSLTACAIAEEPAAPAPSHTEAAASALVPILEQQGSVRVIVGVRAPSALEGSLDPVARSGQRALIAEAQRTANERLAHAGTQVKAFGSIPYVVMHVTDVDGLDAIAADPDVISIEPDLAVAPTLDVSTQLVGAKTAAANGFTGSGWAVAVLDTGVMKTHAHLAGKVVSEACYSTTESSSGAMSLCPGGAQSSTASGAGVNCTGAGCDHGTHVAAIAASSHTTYGGVARGANIVAMQVFTQFTSQTLCNSSSSCVLAYSSDWMEGLERVLALSQSGVKIAAVNMSLGGGQYTGSCDGSFPSVKNAIDNLASAGIATVVAAGNDGYTNAVAFPGCISSAITVGATTKTDAVASYSNMSASVDVVAPGSSIGAAVTTSTTAVGYKSGTSMASPHVAGAFAVMRSAKPTMTVAQGLGALQGTGSSITDTRSATPITKPRIAIAAAINSMSSAPACTRQVPLISVSQPKAVNDPTAVRFTAQITNRDQATCSPQVFDVSAAVPSTWAATSSSTTLAPGASAEVVIDVTAPAATADGSTAIAFTAANSLMTAYSASATAYYVITCGHSKPELSAAPIGGRAIGVHVTNKDDATCGATSTFHMKVTTDLALTPTEGDIVVDNKGDKIASLAIANDMAAGAYKVRVTLADPTGAIVGDETITVTINSDGTTGTDDGGLPDLDLGCSTSRPSGLAGVLLALGFVVRRRRRR